jgi:hypothetical protein
MENVMGHLSVIRKPVHQKTFGLELECYIPKELCLYEDQHIGFWYVSEDGSLAIEDHAMQGFEFISQPMPYAMLQKQIKILNRRIGDWQTNENCGLHIHVSRKYWSDEREYKFSAFLKALHANELILLFGRESFYARPHRDSGHKYRAVNLLHPHTFEFRLWKAGDVHWTLEALRRTKLIVEYKGDWTFDKCLDLFTNGDK